ncbi:c-type cytochrome [Limnobacter sp.]|uniref:c-type cytochrome n=1 Tax=Limnobacter sp. TaxID=2003368 RepID=UPI0027335AD9|nr:c-type cytochrome [Limnobacter sp.]MDP3187787.1 c-type cytochrome [Limnobacter sp.]
MQKFVSLVLKFTMLSIAGSAVASPEMLRKYNCTACHSEDKKKYGPPYQQIALRYADDAAAAEKLAKKIKSGGAGAWGNTPMPPQTRVTDEDALAIAQYILSVK